MVTSSVTSAIYTTDDTSVTEGKLCRSVYSSRLGSEFCCHNAELGDAHVLQVIGIADPGIRVRGTHPCPPLFLPLPFAFLLSLPFNPSS